MVQLLLFLSASETPEREQDTMQNCVWHTLADVQ